MDDRTPTPLVYRPPGRPPAADLTPVRRSVQLLVVVLVLGLVVWRVAHGLDAPRPAEVRVQCRSNLLKIGIAIKLYRQDHGGRYPASLADMLASDDNLSSNDLVCPASAATPAVFATPTPTTQAAAAALAGPDHLSYAYCGGQWSDGPVPADAVVAYEPVADHVDGAHVLFADGDVAFVPTPRAARLIAAAAASTRPVSAAAVP